MHHASPRISNQQVGSVSDFLNVEPEAAPTGTAPDSHERLADLWQDYHHGSGLDELHRRVNIDGVYAPVYFTGSRGITNTCEQQLAVLRRRRPKVHPVDFPPVHSLIPVTANNEPNSAAILPSYYDAVAALAACATARGPGPPPAALIHAYNNSILAYRAKMAEVTIATRQQLGLQARNKQKHGSSSNSKAAAAAASGAKDGTKWVPRLKPAAWAARGTSGRQLQDVTACKLVYKQGYDASTVPANYAVQNYGSAREHAEALAKELEQFENMGVIEYQTALWPDHPADQPHPAFVTILNPAGAVPKRQEPGMPLEVRAIWDCTASTANAYMEHWPMRMPTVECALHTIPAGWCLGKRDWRHGFYHVVLHPDDRKLCGLRNPYNNRIARYACLPMGLSQSPGRFWEVVLEFMRIAHTELTRVGLTEVVLVAYLDDLLIACPTHAMVREVFEVLNRLAEELGVDFKSSKDLGYEEELHALPFLGLNISTEGDDTTLSVPGDKLLAYSAEAKELAAMLPAHQPLPFTRLQSLVGKFGFLSRAYRFGKAYLGSLWDALTAAERANSPTVQLNQEAAEDFAFWCELLSGSRPWHGVTRWSQTPWDFLPDLDYQPLGADACKEAMLTPGGIEQLFGGFGAAWAYERLQGEFTGEELQRHSISALELLAIVKALQEFVPKMPVDQRRRLVIWSDNMAAVAAVNNGTGSRGMRGVLKSLALLAAEYGFDIRTRHLPGTFNVVCDAASRAWAGNKSNSLTYSPLPALRQQWGLEACTFAMFADEAGLPAVHTLPHMRAAMRQWYFTSVQAALAPANRHLLQGQCVWFLPPWQVVGECLEALLAAWRNDPNTRGVGLVPAFKERWWWRRYVQPPKSLFSVVHAYKEKHDVLFESFTARSVQRLSAIPFDIALLKFNHGDEL